MEASENIFPLTSGTSTMRLHDLDGDVQDTSDGVFIPLSAFGEIALKHSFWHNPFLQGTARLIQDGSLIAF